MRSIHGSEDSDAAAPTGSATDIMTLSRIRKAVSVRERAPIPHNTNFEFRVNVSFANKYYKIDALGFGKTPCSPMHIS